MNKPMTRILPQDVPEWKRASKTKTLKAKPLISVMVDRSVMSKFLLTTLEGQQNLGDGTMVCLGETGDIWQQTPKKLLAKYNVVAVDGEGWMTCEPRPDNAVNCFEVTAAAMPEGEGTFYLIGQWGKETPEGPRQEGEVGDFICQNTADPTDVWIVKRQIFINTYSVRS